MISVSQRHPSRLRLVPLALAAVLALAACGSSDDSAGDIVPSATDTSDTGDGDLLAPRPVRTSGGGTGGAAASASAESAPASDRMATDMMMPYRIVTFVPGDDLPALPTDDVGYLFEGGATASAEQFAELASGLGVEGEPIRTDDGSSVYWRVGPEDGSAPSLYLYEDAQLSWSYNSAWATQPAYAGCGVAGSTGAVDPAAGDVAAGDVAVAPPAESSIVDDSCAEPEPPANVPSPDEAEAKTRELMTAVGLDPAAFTFESYGDEWYASSSAVEQLDGSFAGRRVDAGFGAEGALQYVSGQLAQPQRVGPYPLVDLDTAIARLNDTSGFYGYGGGMIDARMMDVAVAAEPGAAAGGAAGEAVGAPVPIDSMPVDSMPVDSMPAATVPEPEEVTVTLVDVQADVWWASDVDGSVWLLPAYRFIGDDDSWYVVPAVTDEFLVQVPVEELPTPEPEPAPLPEPVPVESISPDGIPVDTKPETMPTEQNPGETVLIDTVPLEPSIGTSLTEFTADAEALGAEVRVLEIDGKPQPGTMDLRPNRVNVAVTGEGDAAVVVAILNVG